MVIFVNRRWVVAARVRVMTSDTGAGYAYPRGAGACLVGKRLPSSTARLHDCCNRPPAHLAAAPLAVLSGFPHWVARSALTGRVMTIKSPPLYRAAGGLSMIEVLGSLTSCVRRPGCWLGLGR